jgi:curved DNA-binding protein CbpA
MDSNTARNVLGLPQDGYLDDDDIQEAFREKSKQYHPDTSDLADAREKFLEVKKAREVLLSDGTTRSSQSNSSTTQGGTTQSSTSSRNSTDTHNSSSDPRSKSRTGNTWQTSQSDWRNKTSDWTGDEGPSDDWRTNRTGSSTRRRGSKSYKESHQRKQNTSNTETETQRESGDGTIGDRTDRHQQAWEDNYTWDPYYGFSRGGYFGVDEFPERPHSRSRIYHLLAVIVGCIATALLSRGQYNALKDSTAASRVIEPFVSLSLSFAAPSVLAVEGTFRKVKILWRFLRLPRVYLSILGGSAAPVIIQSAVTNLSVPTAILVAAVGSGSLLSALSVRRYPTEDEDIPTVEEWLNISPRLTWLPGGVFFLLALHTPVYIASQSFHLLYYGSFKFYFILIGPSLALAYIASRTGLSEQGKIGTEATLASMVVIGLVVHFPWFEPIMPGYLLSEAGYYAASSGLRPRGILLTILALSWHFLFAAVVEVLLMGWDVGWHKLPSEQLVPYTAWNALTGAGIGVIIWAIWPAYQAPVAYPFAHQYLIGGIAIFTYVYGIITDPITG